MTIVVVQKEGVPEVGVSVGVLVDVEVAVDAGVEDAGVAVDVRVAVAVAVPVEVGVCVGVIVPVGKAEPVEVDVGVRVEVDTGLGFDVEVEGGGKYTNVFVELTKTVAVLVANALNVGTMVCVATDVLGVCEGTAEAVVMGVLAAVESCGLEENEAPGVRAAFIHSGFARMAGSTGSMNPLGLFVRKSLFGSSLDSTFVSSSHCGVKRSAQPPATRIQKSP